MKKILLLILSLSTIFQMGCNRSQEIAKEEVKNIPIQVSGEDNSILERSEDISDHVVELYGIDDASSIIFNQKALIAVVMSYDVDLDDETCDLIKSIIMERDKDIVDVLVTDDDKVFTEVIDIVIDLMAGIPYDTQVDNINRVIDMANKGK